MTEQDVLDRCNQIEGWMHNEELLWLFQQAKSRQLIVEIGVWQGRSTAALAMGTPGRVYGIDHWQGSVSELETFQSVMRTEEGRQSVYVAAVRNLQEFSDAGKCRLFALESTYAATYPTWFRSIDFLFIDGSHDYELVRDDLVAWFTNVIPGGLIAGHDRNHPGVQRAITEFFGWRKREIKHGPGGIWYVESP